jgi:hypothetical protein
MKTLAKFSGLLLVSFLLTLTSCINGPIDFGLKVPFDLDEIAFTVNPTHEQGEMLLTQQMVQSDLEDMLQKNGAKIEKLKQVTVKEVTFEILSPKDMTFNLLENGEAYFREPGGSSVLIAKIDNIPDDDSRKITLPVASLDDVQKYLSLPEFTFTARAFTSAPIPEPVEMRALLKFEAKVGL